ncbi:MAG: glutamine--fructose-6-phosphate transaminase (isomerizing) [Chloroflexi bacterium]|nr:glutamine--fructose-6-phosphate transaminase (isomerizing) [Chloroflexota bacterium]
MCGIVGYVGGRPAASILFEGLRRLEYRGYDSAGLALVDGGVLQIRRAVGKLDRLGAVLEEGLPRGTIGIGHTRWATHGRPEERNAHPHTDCHSDIVIVHNGIVENYVDLRRALIAEGHPFASDTDTEVIVHLLEKLRARGNDLGRALFEAISLLRGNHAILALDRRSPGEIVAARVGNAGGLTVGRAEGETLVASDLPAILEHTRAMEFLDDGELALVRADAVEYRDARGGVILKKPTMVPWDPVGAARGGFRHFMLKEIHDQPRSLADTIGGRISLEPAGVFLADLGIEEDRLRAITRIVLIGCGTAWHACLCAKFAIEHLARIPCEVDYADEFRYRDPLIDEHTLVVAITQSGETVDVLVSMSEAKRRGAPVVALVNVVGSQASRIADGAVYLHAGPEIGVASTKAFTSMLAGIYLLALHLARARGTIAPRDFSDTLEALFRIPAQVGGLLAASGPYEELAELFHRKSDFLFLGRGISYVIALEGALKLKEISYIHAEGYPAGEMKHGPIALIDEEMPVVAIAPRDHVYDKISSNLEQARARGGKVIAIAEEGDEAIGTIADHVIRVPATLPILSPILTAIPCQLLAYHVAVRRGCDVDQPRNLAKSVTVE